MSEVPGEFVAAFDQAYADTLRVLTNMVQQHRRMSLSEGGRMRSIVALSRCLRDGPDDDLPQLIAVAVDRLSKLEGW
jgi:hypothetical protein